MSVASEGRAYLRRDLKEDNLCIRLGDRLYRGEEDPLPYKYEEEEFFVYLDGWQPAESIDWDFDDVFRE